MAYLIVFVLLVAVIVVIASPLRRGKSPVRTGKAGDRPGTELPTAAEQERIELEAAREAKLREIRDAELDHQTGKLSDDDFQAIDSQLRAEAIAIITRIDALDGLATPEPDEALDVSDAPDESAIADDQSAQ